MNFLFYFILFLGRDFKCWISGIVLLYSKRYFPSLPNVCVPLYLTVQDCLRVHCCELVDGCYWLGAYLLCVSVALGRSTSKTSPSLSDGPRPGMLSRTILEGRQLSKANVGLGAKSLNRDFGDGYSWPQSHYLKRPCKRVDGWGKIGVKYKWYTSEC